MVVVKRDGTEVKFDRYKITTAILGALNESKEGNHTNAQNLSSIVVNVINLLDRPNISVEEIQDIVEDTLMQEGYFHTAKKYILYREEHKKQREFESDLMKAIAKISQKTDRDNANIGHSPASKLYQIGGTASKAFYDNDLIPKHLMKLYHEGFIHIHDFDYYDKTFNCISIPLGSILKNMQNYEFEYGSMQSPKHITTAMSLASIVLQRISNDIFGGTMFPNLDITVQELVDEGYIAPPTDKEIDAAVQALLFNLATMATRAGNQIPFSSITFGLEQGEYGRKFTKSLLTEFGKGMGKGETFIFPNLIYKCLEGVSWKGSPNDDLYDLAVEVSCKRMNPTFNFLDCDYYKAFEPREVNVMGCRTHVIANVNGPAVSEGRGNIFPTTINLPRIALISQGTLGKKNIEDFYKHLDSILQDVKELSLHRYGVLKNLKAYDVPYVMGKHIYYGSENLEMEDKIEPALKHGTIAIGFIGLAETVKTLVGTHHGESDEALQLALDINKYIKSFCDAITLETHLNWTCYATPAESTVNKVIKDREDFGTIEGVTDRDYYTNSYHIPVYFPISIARKMVIEGQFHPMNTAGRISYIELSAPPVHNTEGIKAVHEHMRNCGVGYAGINFPIDECNKCGYSGVIKDTCPKCGSSEYKKIRRVTGYLGFEERINESKGAEIKDRLTHDSVI